MKPGSGSATAAKRGTHFSPLLGRRKRDAEANVVSGAHAKKKERGEERLANWDGFLNTNVPSPPARPRSPGLQDLLQSLLAIASAICEFEINKPCD